MPCYDPYDPASDALDGVRELKRRVDLLTALLCELAQIVGGLNEVKDISPELQQWIKEHRVHDARQGRPWPDSRSRPRS